MKTILDLRPVYHRKDQRIEAHVLLCFLGLLLVRIAELRTGLTWDRIRTVMERLHRIAINLPSESTLLKFFYYTEIDFKAISAKGESV
jgi:transposase